MSEPTPIRVLVVDEHDMVRRSLVATLRLNEDLELVGEARNGREALELVARLQPDVVLMDLMMPVMDGATATRLIRQRWPEVQVIALTASFEMGLAREVLAAGAIGYLLKNVTLDQLAQAIRNAHAGRKTLAPEVREGLGLDQS